MRKLLAMSILLGAVVAPGQRAGSASVAELIELLDDPGYVEGVLRDGAAAARAEIERVTDRALRAAGLR